MQKALIAALWVVVLMFAGWAWADAKEAQAETRQQLTQLSERQGATDRNVAVLQEIAANQKEALVRIETGVNEIRSNRKVRPSF